MAATRRTAPGRGLPVGVAIVEARRAVTGRRGAAPRPRRCCRGPPPRAGRAAPPSAAAVVAHTRAPAPRRRTRPTAAPGRAPRASRRGTCASRVSRSITPKRRGSVKVTTHPDDISNTTWSWRPGGAALHGTRFARPDAEVAGHAEMHHQRLARRQRQHQVLRATRHGLDRGAGEPCGKIGREGTAEVAAPKQDAIERAPLIAGSISRRAASTSGSSGTGSG